MILKLVWESDSSSFPLESWNEHLNEGRDIKGDRTGQY